MVQVTTNSPGYSREISQRRAHDLQIWFDRLLLQFNRIIMIISNVACSDVLAVSFHSAQQRETRQVIEEAGRKLRLKTTRKELHSSKRQKV
jgi:hypothetical protein